MNVLTERRRDSGCSPSKDDHVRRMVKGTTLKLWREASGDDNRRHHHPGHRSPRRPQNDENAGLCCGRPLVPCQSELTNVSTLSPFRVVPWFPSTRAFLRLPLAVSPLSAQWPPLWSLPRLWKIYTLGASDPCQNLCSWLSSNLEFRERGHLVICLH